MLAEGETYIHEFQMAVSALFGVIQCFPDSENARILQGVCFAHATGEPQVGIVVRINAGTATDNFLFIGDDEYFALLPFCQLVFEMLEKTDVGEVAAYLGRVYMAQHLGKAEDLFFGACLPDLGSIFKSFLYLPDA